jgi:hypothetical protein
MKKSALVKIQSNNTQLDKNIEKHLKSIIKKLDTLIDIDLPEIKLSDKELDKGIEKHLKSIIKKLDDLIEKHQ